MALFYFGKSRVFLPKAIGAFVVVLAAVMFAASAGHMFDSWDAIVHHPECLANVGSGADQVAMMRYLDCKDSLYRIAGLQLRPDQQRVTARQFAVTLLRPVAELLFWGAAFLFGLFLYNTRIVRAVTGRMLGRELVAESRKRRRRKKR